MSTRRRPASHTRTTAEPCVRRENQGGNALQVDGALQEWALQVPRRGEHRAANARRESQGGAERLVPQEEAEFMMG